MTVNAVRLNHAVLFVADLERSITFYQQTFDMTAMAREPRANAAFLRPRVGSKLWNPGPFTVTSGSRTFAS